MKRIFKEHGAISDMAHHFGLTPATIRKHLRGQVCTVRTRDIMEYARTHFTFNE